MNCSCLLGSVVVSALPVALLQIARSGVIATDRAWIILYEPKTPASSWRDALYGSCGRDSYPDRLCSKIVSIQTGV